MKLLTAFLDLFSNIWFGVGLMGLALLYMTLGSAFPALRQYYELTELAWFQTPVFNGLLALLVVSVMVVTLRRIPLNRYKLGTWLVHSGLVVLCAGAVVYFGGKVEGDVEIPRRAVEICLPGAEPVRLPAIVGQKITINTSKETWTFEIININPAYMPKRPEIVQELGKQNKKTIYQVDLLVKRPDRQAYYRSILDGFESFNEDFNDSGRLVKQTGKALWDEKLSTRLVLDPVSYFYRKDSAALYVQRLKDTPKRKSLFDELNSQPAFDSQPTTASQSSDEEPTTRVYDITNFCTSMPDFGDAPELQLAQLPVIPADRTMQLWTEHPLMHSLPFYREAFEEGGKIKVPPVYAAQLSIFQTPLMQLVILLAVLAGSVLVSRLMVPPSHLRHLCLGFALLGLVLLGWLAYRWEESSKLLILNHGPLNIPVTSPKEDLQIRVIGYLPYTRQHWDGEGRHVVQSEDIVPKPLRQPLRNVGRTMSMVHVELSRGSWKSDVWVPYVENLHLLQDLQTKVVKVPGLGMVRLAYGRERLPLPQPMALVDFIHEKGLGGQSNADFISLLAVGDPEKGPMQQGPQIKTQLNDPYQDGTYHYFQAAYDPQYLSSTTLLVANRKGMLVMAAGVVLMLSGMVWAFYVKPLLSRGRGILPVILDKKQIIAKKSVS